MKTVVFCFVFFVSAERVTKNTPKYAAARTERVFQHMCFFIWPFFLSSHHVPYFIYLFIHPKWAGSSTETMPSERSCITLARVCLALCFIAYGGMKSLQSQKAHSCACRAQTHTVISSSPPFAPLSHPRPTWRRLFGAPDAHTCDSLRSSLTLLLPPTPSVFPR